MKPADRPLTAQGPSQYNRMNNNVSSFNDSGVNSHSGGNMPRRVFMRNLALGGAFVPAVAALADGRDRRRAGAITQDDANIPRFLAAAEILETDFWQQLTEFANQNGPYAAVLEASDADMSP